MRRGNDGWVVAGGSVYGVLVGEGVLMGFLWEERGDRALLRGLDGGSCYTLEGLPVFGCY